MSKTYFGHHINVIKGKEYITLSDYEELGVKIIETKLLLEALLKTNVVVINGKTYFKHEDDNVITQMILEVLERGKE